MSDHRNRNRARNDGQERKKFTPADDVLAVTVEEFGRRLGVSRATVYNLLSDGKVKSIKLGKSRRIPVSEAQRLLEQDAAYGWRPSTGRGPRVREMRTAAPRRSNGWPARSTIFLAKKSASGNASKFREHEYLTALAWDNQSQSS